MNFLAEKLWHTHSSHQIGFEQKPIEILAHEFRKSCAAPTFRFVQQQARTSATGNRPAQELKVFVKNLRQKKTNYVLQQQTLFAGT